MKADSTPRRDAVSTQDSGLRTQHLVILTTLAVLVALSRFVALSRSIWDWDEGLFCLALRDYNVVLHHPHPPGFPLFIGAAKLVRMIIGDDFHALRAVSLIASMFVFPALYALARALRFSFRTSVIAALLLAGLDFSRRGLARGIALTSSLITLAHAFCLWSRFNPGTAESGGGSDITSSPSVRCDWASVPRY